VRAFARHCEVFPWEWSPQLADEWFTDLRAVRGIARSTLRSYQEALRMFCAFITDPAYGWAEQCEVRFGTHPIQIVEGWLPAFRDATLFKVAYAFGLRRNETRMLDVADFSRNPYGPEFGEYGVLQVRYGKAKKGSPPKRRSVLTVWPWVTEIIDQWVSEARPLLAAEGNPALWPSERGQRIGLQRINSRLAAYRDELGLDTALDFHSLRRSYVTHLIESGMDPLFVQLLLSPQHCVHDVQHEAGTGGDLCGGGGYLPPSITQVSGRFDAGATGADARLAA
jgi:integrase/recombinase XerC